MNLEISIRINAKLFFDCLVTYEEEPNGKKLICYGNNVCVYNGMIPIISFISWWNKVITYSFLIDFLISFLYYYFIDTGSAILNVALVSKSIFNSLKVWINASLVFRYVTKDNISLY